MIFKYINTKNKGPTKTFSSKKVQCEQPYFRRLLLDQMLNHNLDFECARAIRDLELIPQIAIRIIKNMILWLDIFTL